VTDQPRQQPQQDPAEEFAAGSAAPPVAGNGAEGPEPEAAEASGDAVARLEKERDDYLDALQRLKAEFDNFRKRTARDREGIALAATRDVVRDLLPVMDNLERAVAALGDHGEAFDPTVHEAIAAVPSADHADGAVIEVVEKGYRHADHVLRPTRVVIAARPPQ
jgi:molecular chaperone GrpE